jgi:peptide chain release factor subunit 1
MEDAKKLELEQTIEELENYKGRHTELVTIYIPAGYTLTQIGKQVEDEKGTATNIKSKQTRKNVLDALERISRQLKLIKKTPKKGLAIFAGNVSEKEGQTDIKIWTVEPLKPLKIKLYRCDQVFVLEPLKEMVETEEIYGLLIIDRKEATIGLLEGKSIKILQELTSGVPGKIRAGGQSSQRFHRITEGMAKEFFRRVSDAMKKHFFNMEKLKGILIGGPIPTKEEFLDTGNLVTALKEKVIAVKDVGDTGMPGLETLVKESKDALAEQEITKQKAILEEFFTTLAKEPGKATYKEKEVEERLKQGAVAKLILSKTLQKPKIKELDKLATQTSAEIHFVTKETPEGVQFDNLGGIGAILRYALA